MYFKKKKNKKKKNSSTSLHDPSPVKQALRKRKER